MTSPASRPRPSSGSRRRRVRRLALLAAAASLWCVGLRGETAGGDAAAEWRELSARRAARRGAVQAGVESARQHGGASRFGLLVIPVDFADARLPADWNAAARLGPRLFPSSPPGGPIGDPPTLGDYFRVASHGRTELAIVLAPLIRLPQPRLSYSDLGLSGFSRSRRLAAEAIAAARDAGVALRLADNDGPDGCAGSGDDDGEVDGVLILHADRGDENEPQAGVIQALQYYLDEPVLDGGVAARLYATASLHSGLGIWAHETAHLLGLEDRYDPFLPSGGSELAGRGGLGIFSLMAAGAFGIGGGEGAALLDAYSASLLGWCDLEPRRARGGAPDTLRSTAATGTAWRVWTHGAGQDEYFILETRGGAAAGPLDAALPAGQLLVLHVDESLPERAQSSSDPAARHLRVRVVEADGGDELRRGLDAGGVSDLFPGPLGRDAWGPDTEPSSSGYGGPSEVSVTGIASLGEAVRLVLQDASSPAFALSAAFSGENPQRLVLAAQERGTMPAWLAADVVITAGGEHGTFAAGDSLALELTREAGGAWRPAADPVWLAAPDRPAGARSTLRLRLRGPEDFVQLQRLEWLWRDDPDALAFGAAWPGGWRVETPGGEGTTWHRWVGPPYLAGDGDAVLACTGSEHTAPAAWPQVAYRNGADAWLTTPPLSGGAALRLVHAIDGEVARPGLAWDGGLVEFVLADGSVVPAEPLEGYGGRIEPTARQALHGRAAFAGQDEPPAEGGAWRIDLFVPPEGVPGATVRLRLRFAADEINRGRGWLVAKLDGVAPPQRGAAFPVSWLVQAGSEPALVWDWPWERSLGFRVEASGDQGARWDEAWSGAAPAPADGWPHLLPSEQLSLPPVAPGDRILLRVTALTAYGPVVSRPVAATPVTEAVGSAQLGVPYPNPSRGAVRLPIAVADGTPASLSLFDARGRRLAAWRLGGGRQWFDWDGRDGQGRPLAAGVYLLRLEAGGAKAVRKVVRLR